ncbi:MAG TPA: DNA polymerase III subunit gamma/tau [Thermoanaerobaculia bacterium]|jgi:DNA polymerase-3 subunit gamma/tau|nr:DNA polymerase III subunit gamma/tau [Thermoanaerobaculia bacterium]
MAYQVLARKWRPQSFSTLVGQGPIVTALRNAVQEGRIAQAYLFSGIRGVGKTTTARLLAKMLNCERGPAADPCNKCMPCIEITRGSDLDVIEVDAATYSKVEQVRELTESLKYGAARDRYKVVILDEIHRLSRQAFDALLKIVEEPPPHLVFIFATTEIDAVPATILSRCQEFHFRRVSSQDVADLLRHICGQEGIEATDTALRLVARAGEGSVRDAVALLDQLATFGSGKISDEDAVRLLGGLDTALFHRLLEAILQGDGVSVTRAVRRVEDEGWDPRHVYGHFLVFCRDALHLAMGGDPDQSDLPVEEAQALTALAKEAGYENMLRLLHQLLNSEQTVRRSETGALAVEIAWLRAAELPKLRRVEELLAGGAMSTAAAPAQRPAPRPAPAPPVRTPSPPPPPPAPAPVKEKVVEKASAPVPVAAPPPAPPPAAAPAPAPRSNGSASGEDLVQAFLDEVSRRKQPLAAYLSDADEIRFEEGRLTIARAPGDTWLESRLGQSANRQIIDEAVAAVWGEGTTWKMVQGDGRRAAELQAQASAASAAGAVVSENPTVQTVLDIFGGRVERVEERPREE